MKNKIFIYTSLIISSIILIAFLGLEINNINYGIDLKGGFEVLYKVESLDGSNINNSTMSNTYKILQNRIDMLGVSEPEIIIEQNDTIRVRLAGVTSEDEARSMLSQTATLTFRDTSDNLLMDASVLNKNAAKVSTDSLGNPAVLLSVKDVDTFYDVTSTLASKEDNLMVIWLDFEEGVDSYSTTTCGVSGSNCLSAATVKEGFASDVIIQGNFTLDEVNNLVDLINSGAFPVKLNEISSKTVSASLGENALKSTFIAAIVGILLVMLFMIAVYRLSGFVTSCAIIAYAAVVFFVFYMFGGVLTLPGIAALVLGIGMALDANIITFERIKDELKTNKELKYAFKYGNQKSLATLLDANTTTFIIATILFIFGNGAIKGFGLMLMINIFATALVMIFLVRWILSKIVNTGIYDDKLNTFIGYKEHKEKKKFDFLKNRYVYLAASSIIILLGLSYTYNTGLNYNVEFSGGTVISTESSSNNNEINKMLDENYTVLSDESSSGTYTVKLKEVITSSEEAVIKADILENYNQNTSVTVISDIVSKSLIKNALISLLIAAILISIYITVRYKWTYAVSAIIALLHDTLLVLIVFSVFKLEISNMFIAAILTIIGYSINDTIVTFDRIKETTKNSKYKKDSFYNVVNNSINETIRRSIYTSITTLLPVLLLIIMGSSELYTFDLALFIGLLVGTYSSVFIASNILYILETWVNKGNKSTSKKKKKKEKKRAEELLVKGVNC